MATLPNLSDLEPWLLWEPTTGFRFDFSSMGLSQAYLQEMDVPLTRALSQMNALEGGSLANPDEGRFVGHYWLREPSLAPDPTIQADLRAGVLAIQSFVSAIHARGIKPPKAERYKRFLQIGIGGSALGPQLIHDALRSSNDRLSASFLDNTDPDGIDRLLDEIGSDLPATLVLVVSKSGGTKETRNGMLEIKAAMKRQGLSFEAQAIAVTMPGSALDRQATSEGWLQRFPLWDWVGGRTSLFSAVGLLPAALQGIDLQALLTGAAAMDRWTREAKALQNPAALLALSWFFAGQGRGDKDMVILPYKDRLLLLSRYLQQLVMESLGKKVDLEGRIVHQGIVVYGNKGSTDQHAFVQQLREGPTNFFVNFIEVLRDRSGETFFVEPGITSGDYLLGFLLGTRQALAEEGRPSVTITMPDVSAFSLAALIALYERAVGLYAFLVGINAYHQPGVEAGKKAASQILALQERLLRFLEAHPGHPYSLSDLASALGGNPPLPALLSILEHLSANHRLHASGTPPHRLYRV